MSTPDVPPADGPPCERQPFQTWTLRWLLFAVQAAALTALATGWILGQDDVSVPGAIGFGVTYPLGWVVDGIEVRRGVEKKGSSGLPFAARLGLWVLVTVLLAVPLVVVSGLVGLGVGLFGDGDWTGPAWRGLRIGLVLSGGFCAVGVVTFGSAWLAERLFPPPPKGPNGRWITIDLRAYRAWLWAVLVGAGAAMLLVLSAVARGVAGADAPPSWLRLAGLVLCAASAALAIVAARRASRPGAFRVERRGDDALSS